MKDMYIIVNETESKTFLKEVNKKFDEGYVCTGGISYIKGNFLQAMVCDIEKDELKLEINLERDLIFEIQDLEKEFESLKCCGNCAEVKGACMSAKPYGMVCDNWKKEDIK